MTNKLQVEAIHHGTVIDHIPAGQGKKILERLQLLDTGVSVTVGFNLPSQLQGLKDIIKVTNHQLTEQEAGQLALFAPGATINVIDDYTVTDKFKMAAPETLTGAFPCPNSNCITHNEPVQTLFRLRQADTHVVLKCHYCERSFSQHIVADLG